jgi:histidinol-phosphate aminotransferase
MIGKSSIERFIRQELRSFGAYSAAVSPESLSNLSPDKIIKLDQNENLFGCSPRVKNAMANFSNYNIYPDADQMVIRNSLAKYTDTRPENIVAANGSNQLLDIITRLFVGQGDSAVNFIPTFDIYRFSIQICGGKLIELQRDEDFAINTNGLEKFLDKTTKLIFLANPNAPTGNLTPQEDIIKLLETGIPTVVDEAYFEFSGVTVLPLMKQYDNLMVIRTFSKWAGLAGLRVGYGIFPIIIANYLHRIKIPYNVNVAALLAVEESMKDIEYLMGKTKEINREKDRLLDKLRKVSWLKPYPSQANFILCQVLKGRAKDVQQKLQADGILIRYFDKPRLNNCIRISVGKPEHTDLLIKALQEIRQ